ncbi:hypothetical protein [Microtetraspora sp. NBRC 13810]|uniref:hypothetical protein n=1 Tax=Microtetraspora sp. NBRC 13810 TaxID=3030990 RepID=UPI002556BAE2|nr:hypothetical protein [Microtetraspora sp. NBRC 13810]
MRSGPRRWGGFDPIWPADRYEVLCERRGPFEPSLDRYHSPALAVESARALETAGLASRVMVVRLADGVVIYDRVEGIALPPEEW